MIVGFIVFLGLLLRFLMVISEKSLWGDEWFSIEIAQKSFLDVFSIFMSDVHTPFFYAILHFLIKWLGPHEGVFRLIPLFSGVGTIILVYALARRITGDRCASLLATFLVAISPYFLHLSYEIRGYGLMGFIACLATFLFIRLAEGKKTSLAKIFYVLAAISVIYLEHYGWFWLLGIAAYTVYLYITKRILDKGLLWLQALVILLCLPSLGIIAYQAVHTESAFVPERTGSFHSLSVILKKGTAVIWHFACGPYFSMLSTDQALHYVFHSPLFWLSFVLTIVLLVLCIKSLIGLARKRTDFFILVVFVLLFPILFLLFFYPIRLHSRYLAFAAPYFLILAGDSFAKRLRKKWAVILLIGLTGYYLYVDYHFIKMKTDPVHREDYPSMIQYAFENAGFDDVICGLFVGPQAVPYYEQRLKLQRRAAYFYSCYELAEESSLEQFNKIWLMGYMNMDEEVNARNLAYFKDSFKKAGFISMRHAKRFGGETGLTSVYLFEKI